MSIPKKLTLFLETLPQQEREEKLRLFEEIVVLAQENGLQSPTFWASRQVIKGRNRGQIDHEIARRRHRQLPID